MKGQQGTSRPNDDPINQALAALARLLARQAAHEATALTPKLKDSDHEEVEE